MPKAVIIDPSLADRRHLAERLNFGWPQLNIAGYGRDLISGVRIINAHEPQIVFIEIDLPSYSGFKILECFENPFFEVIFVTSRTDQAIKAFRMNASAYILKPVSLENLRKPISKILERHAANPMTAVASVYADLSPLVLPAPSGFYYLKAANVSHLNTEGKNTFVYRTDGPILVISRSLKECLEIITNPRFIRINRSTAINLLFLKQYNRGIDSHVVLECGMRIDVGKPYKDDLANMLNHVLK